MKKPSKILQCPICQGSGKVKRTALKVHRWKGSDSKKRTKPFVSFITWKAVKC